MTRIVGVTVLPQGYILILSHKYVWVFDLEGLFVNRFDTLTRPECIAVDRSREGQVLVSDMGKGILRIHSCPTGKVVNTIRTAKRFTSNIVVNSKNQILLYFNPPGSVYSKVVAIDYSGNEVFSFTPRVDTDMSGEGVLPGRIVCDEEDCIYIAIRASYKADVGQIHRYSPTGVFVQYIARGLHRPCDLTFSFERSLIVANRKSILVYSSSKWRPSGQENRRPLTSGSLATYLAKFFGTK